MAYATGNSVLSKLPPLEGKEELLVDNQDVDDIIGAVIESHKMFADHYDQIWDQFYDQDVKKVCKALFNFCKKQVPYNVESDNFQTVKSPAAILSLGSVLGGDCKHYASFIGGILDSIKRNTGDKIDWTYRFASYDWFNHVPEHVFVVVNPGKKNELWVDPVLDVLDSRTPSPSYTIDKRPKMSLVRISGIENNNARIGVAPVVAAALISAVPAVAGIVAQVFGGKKELESSGVRKLVSYYRNNVAGSVTNVDVPSENVSPQEADIAQLWFTTVLGVPIYDILRYYALAGIATKNGALIKDKNGIIREPKNILEGGLSNMVKIVNQGEFIPQLTDQARILNYKQFWDAEGFSDAQILQAIQISNWMRDNNRFGGWSNMVAADSEVNNELIKAYNAANPDAPPIQTANPTDMPTSITDIVKKNPLATAGIVAVAGWGIYSLTKKKKSVGKVDNNTILYIGLGAAAVFLLTRKSTGTTNMPVYQPYPNQYPVNSNNQANVWSFLDSLADLAAGIFVKKPSGGSGNYV